MTFFNNLKKILKKTETFGRTHNDERVVVEDRLNEYLTEERNRQKIFEEKQYQELQEKTKERDEERITAENRFNEYLAEERKRKNILEEKLSEELKIKKRDEIQTGHKKDKEETKKQKINK